MLQDAQLHMILRCNKLRQAVESAEMNALDKWSSCDILAGHVSSLLLVLNFEAFF